MRSYAITFLAIAACLSIASASLTLEALRSDPAACVRHSWLPVEVYAIEQEHCQPGVFWFSLFRECEACGQRQHYIASAFREDGIAKAIYAAWRDFTGR